MTNSPFKITSARTPASGEGHRRAGRVIEKAWRPRVYLATGTVLLVGLVIAAVALSRAPGSTPRAAHTAWRDLPGRTPAPATRAAQPEVESHLFQVAEVTGRVETHRGERWALVSRGDVLTQDDVVRTFNGRAVLKFGGVGEVELRDGVEIRLDSISRAGASLDLRHGKVVARIGRTGSNIVITAAKTRTENDRSLPARFVVLADERGRVTVAATEGEARFESAGRAVVVPAGRVTQAGPGQAPDDPETIPEEIFLSVIWPTRERRVDDAVPITGRVDPRSVVHVNGVPVEADPDGRFTSAVPAHHGVNPVVVEVEDISGRVKVEKGEVRKVVPARPPDLEPVRTELWK